MNKYTLHSKKELGSTAPWLTAMKGRQERLTPTYEMQQRQMQTQNVRVIEQPETRPIFTRVSNEVADRIEQIKADLAELPLQSALA